jgi:hypothetical protein
MKLLQTDEGQAKLTSVFNEGARGAFGDLATRVVASPEIGDESRVFELTFSIPELGRGVGYFGITRIREVLTVVAIVGLEDMIHENDLYSLMELTARRVRGEAPPAKQQGKTAPVPVGQSA